MSTSLSAGEVEDYTKACDAGNNKGCSDLGLMYFQGKSVVQSDTKAKEFFDKACNGADCMGCYMLGAMYVNGRSVKQDSIKAMKFFNKSCNAGMTFVSSAVPWVMVGCCNLYNIPG